MAVKRVLIKIIRTKRVKGYSTMRCNPEGTQTGIVQRKAHRRVQMCEFEQSPWAKGEPEHQNRGGDHATLGLHLFYKGLMTGGTIM